MTSFTILHCADLHLGSPFTSLFGEIPEQVASMVENATAGILARIVDEAIEHQVDVLTVAGDLFDTASPPVSVQYQAWQQFERLAAVGIEVVVSAGNHDYLNGPLLYPWPSNVHVLGRDSMNEQVEDVLIRVGDIRVQFSGFSYTSPELYGSKLDEFSRRADADFAVALYHGQVGNAQSRHAPYAAVSRTEMAKRSDFDAWLLGHIHAPQILSDRHPVVLYPGTPQGRDRTEQGSRGVYLVQIAVEQVPQIRWIDTATVIWQSLDVDVTGLETLQEVADELLQRMESEADTDALWRLFDVRFHGFSPLFEVLAVPDTAAFFQELVEKRFERAYLYRVKSLCEPDTDWEALSNSDGYVGELLQLVEQLERPSQAVMEELLALLDVDDREQVTHALRDFAVDDDVSLEREAIAVLYAAMNRARRREESR